MIGTNELEIHGRMNVLSGRYGGLIVRGISKDGKVNGEPIVLSRWQNLDGAVQAALIGSAVALIVALANTIVARK